MTTIELERTYPHPIGRVWRALTDPAALAQWLMPNDFEPRVGHRFQFRTDPGPGFDGIVDSEVLELVEPERLVLSWNGGGIATVVTFRLMASGASTKLVITQTGFEGARGAMTRLILKAGFFAMLRKRIPPVLEALARGEEIGAATTREPKRDRSRGVLWRALSRLFAPFLRRGGRADPTEVDGRDG